MMARTMVHPLGSTPGFPRPFEPGPTRVKA